MSDPARPPGAQAASVPAAPRSHRRAGTFVRASGTALPFRDDSVDVCLSSNVAEHVAQPWRLGSEMLLGTKIGRAGQQECRDR